MMRILHIYMVYIISPPWDETQCGFLVLTNKGNGFNVFPKLDYYLSDIPEGKLMTLIFHGF